jgi:hypothetical protein
VPTFESIGLYWKPAHDPGAEGCPVRYRKQGAREWRYGLALWFDARNGECRGSLVHLEPGTAYEIALGEARVRAATWSEEFPISEVVTLPAGSLKETYFIRRGGRPDGYVLYRAHPEGTTIDVEDQAPHNVVVSASHVIVRGLVLKGAQRDAVLIRDGARDVVIERSDISGWGRYKSTSAAGWKLGVDMDSGIRADCRKRADKSERVVIQHNRIHSPRYGANSWSSGHPAGPQGISFLDCGGNHVIRHNRIVSDDPRHYFNDAIGGEENFSDGGFPNRDSDIHDNVIAGAWDDAIEAEGGNMNVRIWGNRIERAYIGIATTVTHHGPLYVFGNRFRAGRKLAERPEAEDERGPMIKAGEGEYRGRKVGGGRRYVFHNVGLDVSNGIAGNTKQPLTNTVSRNNVWMLARRHWPAIHEAGGTGNDLDYDLSNGKLSQRHGVTASDPEAGKGRGVRIPNFSEPAEKGSGPFSREKGPDPFSRKSGRSDKH